MVQSSHCFVHFRALTTWAGIQWAFEQRLVKYQQMNDVELEGKSDTQFNIGTAPQDVHPV